MLHLLAGLLVLGAPCRAEYVSQTDVAFEDILDAVKRILQAVESRFHADNLDSRTSRRSSNSPASKTATIARANDAIACARAGGKPPI